MNTDIETTNTISQEAHHNPGAELAALREQKGLSLDYVAGRLNLRVRVIEQLEVNDFANMPEDVFVQGYIRAYAKLLDENPEPFVAAYKQHHGAKKIITTEAKSEKILLWQGKREANRSEKAVRWITGLVAAGVLAALGAFWLTGQVKTTRPGETAKSTDTSKTQVSLTEVSKMQSLFRAPSESLNLEK